MTPEVDQIKDDIRACTRVVDVNESYKLHHPTLAKLWKEGGEMRTMCIQVKNLRDYMIKAIKAIKADYQDEVDW